MVSNKMTGDWEVNQLPLPTRFFEYANAYLEASRMLTVRMRDDPEQNTWPNACVTMMLAAHAVELFLKGAIASRDPARLEKSHKLDALFEIFDELFPEPDFDWEMPFSVDYGSLTEEEAEAFKKSLPVPSIKFRYPVDNGLAPWAGAHGFTPVEFALSLASTAEAFQRIRSLIDASADA